MRDITRWFCALALLTLAQRVTALDWQSHPGYRSLKVSVPAVGKTGFTQLDANALGIDFTNRLSDARVLQFQNLMNGSGVACGDVDEDGWTDLYLCNKEGPNGLYRNLGNGRFTNITAAAGVGCAKMISVGAVFGDINGDGHLDLLVTSFGGPHACFIGNGRGGFTDFTQESGIGSKLGTTSLALSDLDGDGDLDLYLCNFGTTAILRDGGTVSERTVNGLPTVTGRWAKKLRIENGRYFEYGDPDTLLLNDGRGHFTPVPWETAFTDEAGQPMEPPWDFGLAVQIRDVNQDGNPDIYVCNDFQTPDRLWYGDGRGHFRAAPPFALRNMSYASMGVDFADIDRDGFLDFVTVEMLSIDHSHHLRTGNAREPKPRFPGLGLLREDFSRNNLFHNRGDNTWEEIACFSGVAATSWSWTALFLDVDLDGWEDLLVSNGHMHDVNDRDVNASFNSQHRKATDGTRDVLANYPPLDPQKVAFRNRHDLTFEDVSTKWGFNSTSIAHGMATLDLDNDGDLDLVLNCQRGGPLIYRNDSIAPRVAVRAAGKQWVGAKLRLEGGPVTQTQEILAGGYYLSGAEASRTFAAGDGSMKLFIETRSGKKSVISGIRPNSIYDLGGELPSDGDQVPKPPPPLPVPLFEDISSRVGLSHYEESFDDYAQQPMLPRGFSQLGPGVAVGDANGDGFDDIVMGTGRGGRLTAAFGDGSGRFRQAPISSVPAADDQIGVAISRMSEGAPMVLATQANYEQPQVGRPSLLEWTLGKVPAKPILELPNPSPASIAPLALGDLDGDGTLSLFLGGRIEPKKYPGSVGGSLFRAKGDRWELDLKSTESLAKAGLVSASTFADLDLDGTPELVLACEWGPIRVYSKKEGALTETTAQWGLDRMTGWWNSIAAGDFDGDGRLDLVAGNWGLNSLWQTWSDEPPRIYFGDLSDTGTYQLFEAIWDPTLKQIVPWRNLEELTTGFPLLAGRMPNHKQFSTSTLEAVLGDSFSRVSELRVATLQSMVFLNRGSKLEPRPLPRDAQMAPVFGISIADFDGDGREDLFVAQNNFAVRTLDMRLDAGRGILLRGGGESFSAVPGDLSGLKIYGEQRGSAVGDFDRDGRPDLVVTQNGTELKAYRNSSGIPGLRVRLAGPEKNPSGFGATVRLQFGERLGPARLVSGGGGYCSQDSATLVLSTPEVATGIEVRWPGGAVTKADLTLGAKEVTVGRDGVMSQ